jgi:hypothetical protein
VTYSVNVKKIAIGMFSLGSLLFPVRAFAEQLDNQREIPPVELTPQSTINPLEAEPIDKSAVVISQQTPVEELASMMGPVMLGLTAIVVWLAIWTWSKAVDEIHPPERG